MLISVAANNVNLNSKRFLMMKWLVIALKIFWLALAAFGFYMAIQIDMNSKQVADSELGVGLYMLAISFPAGTLLSLVATIIGELFGIYAETSKVNTMLTWFFLFILGYLQWFWFIPYCYNKIRNYIKNRGDKK
jgi:hypothetical protein